MLAQRPPIVLSLLQARASANLPPTPISHPPLTIHDLYADGIAVPSMQQFANHSQAAAATIYATVLKQM